jgi:predicted MFS family arabinose efflux permease
MVSGPIGGYVASKPFGYMPFISAGIMFLLIPITLLFLREKKNQVNSHDLLKNAGKQLVNIGTAGTMWAVTGLMALFYIAPAASTAIFYRQQDLLHLDTQGQGYLVFLGGLGSVLSAILYGLVCKRINLRNLLFICLASATIANLGYLFYTTVGHARAVETINGFGFSLAECALIDLAMRAIPKGSEGLGFALMMSVRNFALFGSDIFGSWLLDKRNWTFSALIISNSATTIIVLPLLLFLPTVMLLRKDAERAST